MSEQIKTIVFDLGKVLIDFSFDPFAKFLKERGVEFESIQDLATNVRMIEHERGETSKDEFIENALSLLKVQTSAQELTSAWTNIFSPHQDMLDLCQSLKPNYTVCILSNTSIIHWEHLKATYDLDSRAHHLFASFEVGALKPNPVIYNAVLEKVNCKPSEMVFIDDIEENAIGATKCGWNGITHRGFLETKKELDRLGVAI